VALELFRVQREQYFFPATELGAPIRHGSRPKESLPTRQNLLAIAAREC
jgi:hypothetical protein